VLFVVVDYFHHGLLAVAIGLVLSAFFLND
jgi:hypothetical protein